MPTRFPWLVPYFVCVAIAAYTAKSLAAEQAPAQALVSIPVRVIDPEGQPVAGAKIVPWALRSSQGHGLWRSNDRGDKGPMEVTTDADGRAEVAYPRYRYLDERVRTTEVTLSIDHGDFVRVEYEFVNVPRTETGPREIKLERGATVEVMPLIDGRPAAADDLYVLWSDARSWRDGFAPRITSDGALRLPPMPAGEGQMLVVRLEDGKATHFSRVVDLDLKEGTTCRTEVDLRPSIRITGVLSENVPRPVTQGRISAQTLPRTPARIDVEWNTWAPIAEDGSFEIDAWPAGEDIQTIALSDGYIAASGKRPAVVDAEHAGKGYHRPQVFAPSEFTKPIVIDMLPMARCDVEATDQKGAPLRDVSIFCCPNVGWWNGGSQVYCTPLARGERLLVNRDFFASLDNRYPPPFQAKTDADGRATMFLPAGKGALSVQSDAYELPVNRGRRDQSIVLAAGATTKARLRLQPRGTEYLGDWDKLAGVLFGCTGDECRRLLEDPGFRKKMVKVGELFDSAPDARDPQMLKQAYSEIAAGFDDLKDQEEADRWREKSAEQAARLAAPQADEKSH